MAEVLRAVQGDRLTFDLKLTLHNERYELGYNEKVYFNVFTRSYEPDFKPEQVLYLEQESTTISIDKVELDPGEYSFDAGIIFSDGTTKTVLPCIKNQKNTLQVLDKTCIDRYDIRGSIYDEAFDASIKDSMCNCAEIERIYRLIAKMDSNSFMTVQNINELDEIPKNRIANGKLVRVEDNGDGQSEYFSYDKGTDRWIPEYIVNDGMLPSIFGTSDTDIIEHTARYGVRSGTEDKDTDVIENIGIYDNPPSDKSLYINVSNGNIFLCNSDPVMDNDMIISYNIKYSLIYSDHISLYSIANLCASELEVYSYKYDDSYFSPSFWKVKPISESEINNDFYNRFTLNGNDNDAIEIFDEILQQQSISDNSYTSKRYILNYNIAELLIEFINDSNSIYIRSQRISRLISMCIYGYVRERIYYDQYKRDTLDRVLTKGDNILYNSNSDSNIVLRGEDSSKGNIIINPISYGTPVQISMRDKQYDGNAIYGAGVMQVTRESGSMAAAKRKYVSIFASTPSITLSSKYITSTLEERLTIYVDRIDIFHNVRDSSSIPTGTIYLPKKSGTFALLDDIPSISNLLQAGIQSYSSQSYNYNTGDITVSDETNQAIAALNDGQLFFVSYNYGSIALYLKNSNDYGNSLSTSTRLALYSDINAIRNKMKSLTPPVQLSYCGNLNMSYPMDLDASAFSDYDGNPDHKHNQIWGHNNESVRPGTIIHNGMYQNPRNGITQLWMVTTAENGGNNGNVYQNYWTVPIPVIRTDAIMKRLNKISVSQYSDIANVEEGQIFKYNGRYCVRTGHGEEYDYAYEDISTGGNDLARISDIPDNINKESGYVYDTALFSVEEGISDVVINGTYVLEGDYCKIDAEAKLVDGWAVVYYSLPVVAIATGCTIEHHVDGNQYSIRTMHQNGNIMNVLGIRRLDNSNLGSSPSSIHFHLEYKYR